MSLEIEQIAKTFISHKFEATFPYMADEIKWIVIGREENLGKEAVMAKCADARKFLATVTTTFEKLQATRAGETVFVEGACLFRDGEGQTSAWPAATSLSFRKGNLLRLLPTSSTWIRNSQNPLDSTPWGDCKLRS
jgi:hypothetical protein